MEANIYNIGGSNYFKLRDIAALLEQTDACFDVSYDAARQRIAVTKGAPYTYVGGELSVGADQSASCVPSSQKLLLDGAEKDVRAYNIGGNNYFKLVDLSEALGFRVRYDEASRTVFLETGEQQLWLVSRETATTTMYGVSNTNTQIHIYDSRGNLLRTENIGGVIYTYTYDGQNNRLTSTTDYGGSQSITTYEYDARGNMTSMKIVDGNGNVSSSYSYTYNERNDLLSYQITGSSGSTYTYTYQYDASGRLLSYTVVRPSGSSDTGTYAYDASGRLYSLKRTESGGRSYYTTFYQYDEFGNVLEERGVPSSGDGYATAYTYDLRGNVLTEKVTGKKIKNSRTEYTYDSYGNLTASKRYDLSGNGSETLEASIQYEYVQLTLRN